MSRTVFVRGSGGAIFQMDVPDAGHQRELFDMRIGKGEYVIVPEERVRTVEAPYGADKDGRPLVGTRFVEVDGDAVVDPPAAEQVDGPVPARGRAKKSSKAKPDPAPEAADETDDSANAPLGDDAEA